MASNSNHYSYIPLLKREISDDNSKYSIEPPKAGSFDIQSRNIESRKTTTDDSDDHEIKSLFSDSNNTIANYTTPTLTNRDEYEKKLLEESKAHMSYIQSDMPISIDGIKREDVSNIGWNYVERVIHEEFEGFWNLCEELKLKYIEKLENTLRSNSFYIRNNLMGIKQNLEKRIDLTNKIMADLHYTANNRRDPTHETPDDFPYSYVACDFKNFDYGLEGTIKDMFRRCFFCGPDLNHPTGIAIHSPGYQYLYSVSCMTKLHAEERLRPLIKLVIMRAVTNSRIMSDYSAIDTSLIRSVKVDLLDNFRQRGPINKSISKLIKSAKKDQVIRSISRNIIQAYLEYRYANDSIRSSVFNKDIR